MTGSPRLGIEDTLHAMLDVLQEIAVARSSSSSSLDIEDMAKGPPKVTTHGSVGVPMSEEYIRARIAEHGLAHRLAEQAYVNQWADTLDAVSHVRMNGCEQVVDGLGSWHWKHTARCLADGGESLPDFNVGPVVAS